MLLEELEKLVPTEIGTIENYRDDNGEIRLTLALCRPVEASARSVKRALEAVIEEKTGITPFIIVKEPAAKAAKAKAERAAGLRHVARVVAVASGKGGVGKSTVAANLARSMAARGMKVGLLDADIYGPSQPALFHREGYQPVAADDEGKMIVPALTDEGIALMSIGFFIKADDALVWRGPMATNALRQLIHQTAWGELDMLVVDLPPGTGDVHLTVVGELKVDSAIIVTTPSPLALADALRGIKMFRAENINVPIAGVVSNMAYFETSDLPGKRYYVFGEPTALQQMAAAEGIEVLAEIPLGDNSPTHFDVINL
ncbi:MAG: Mrp/NBP35 family ATP-binding protein [Mucinivorans sp.]